MSSTRLNTNLKRLTFFPIQRGNGNGTYCSVKETFYNLIISKQTRKKERKEDTDSINSIKLTSWGCRGEFIHHSSYRRTIERRAACSMKAKRRKRNETPEKGNVASTRPEDTSSLRLWLIDYGGRSSTSTLAFGISSPWSFPSRSSIRLHAVVQTWLYLQRSVRHETFRPLFRRLRHSPSSWAAVVHWSALIPKALWSSRRHPIHYISCPPTQPAPPTSSPNISHFGSLVFVRATIPTNRIRLLRIIASILSLPDFMSVSR